MSYNIFTDFHHAGLLQSLILLFEKRLGGNVYRPIGIEWAEEGFWHVYDHPATRLQFLTYDQGYRPQDGTKSLNMIEKVQDDVYYCQDIDSGSFNKAISLEKFKTMPIDIVIASIPAHIEPFKRLIAMYKPKAKLIYQIGNAWNVEPGQKVANVMASARVSIPTGVNYIIYHQEFDQKLFAYREPVESMQIASMVNCFDVDHMFRNDWELFTKVEKLMPEWSFRALGGQCRDGAAHGSKEVANTIGASRFLWHTKIGGDGYGHIVHNAASVGRPLIVKKGYYDGKLGGDLMIDTETCIAIDGLSPQEIVNKIEHYNDRARYSKMSEATRTSFEKVVDFDAEQKAIETFLSMLI